MHRRALAALIVTAVAAAGTLTGVALEPHPVRPCVTEDSAGPCVWHADTRGNRRGRSFIRHTDGSVTYLERK